MRVLLQRVSRASVAVAGKDVGVIGKGLLLLVGAGPGDDEQAARAMATKCANLRIFADADDRMNHSVLDVGGECLVVSQFTLYGECKKGRRPFFGNAMAPEPAQALVAEFGQSLEGMGLKVAYGQFGAMMAVSLVNDGPVTLWLDSEAIL